MAIQALSEERVLNGLSKLLYKMLKEEMTQGYVINNDYEPRMVAEPNGSYGKN